MPRTKQAPAGPPPFPGVEPRAVKSLATKLAKLDDSYRIRDAVKKVAGDADPQALGWYLVVHDLVDAAQHDALIGFLGADDLDEPRAAALARMLARRKDVLDARSPLRGGVATWLPGWTTDLDAIAYRAVAVAPAAFAEHEAGYGEQARLGLAFVRRRRGQAIDAALSSAIVTALAEGQATDYGISGGGALPFVDDSGVEVGHRAGDKNDLASLRTVALRFGSAEAWDAALAAAVKRNRWGLIENVESALRQLPLAELSQVFATRGDRRLFSDSSNAVETVIAVMEARGDDPEALLATPAHLPESESDAAAVRELYATIAARRLSAAGKPVPPSFDEAMSGFRLINDRYAGEAVLEALRAVPRERVLAMVQKALPKAWDKAPLAALGAHYDEAILADALAQGGYMHEAVLAAIGAPAVAPLGRAAREATEDDVRRARYDAMLLAMGRALARGEAPDPSWDAWIEIGQTGGKPVKGWLAEGESGRALEGVLARMPEARRDAILRRALAASPEQAAPFVHLGSDALVDEALKLLLGQRKLQRAWIDKLGKRAVEPLVRHVHLCQGDAGVMEALKRSLRADDYARVQAALGGAKETKQAALVRIAAAAVAAAPGSARERVYVVESASDEVFGRAGSMSRAGGAAAGLGEDAIPKDDDGEPLEHLLTLDLDDVPELRARYPEARAIALFAPEPGTGERHDETEIVPIPKGASMKPPGKDHALAITGVEVPSSVFARGEHPAEVKALRDAIWRAGGHVLGRPLWIQDDEGDEGLLIQINDGLVDDLNLGDAGSLYVFDGGEAVFQCH